LLVCGHIEEDNWQGELFDEGRRSERRRQ
jgi:hypothetical protein